MKANSIPALLALLIITSGTSADSKIKLPRDRPPTSYVIRAELSPILHTVKGSEKATWINQTRFEAKELKLHLYMAAFNNNNSLFNRESLFESGSYRKISGTSGGIEIQKVRIKNGTDVTERIRLYETVMVVPLEKPIKPGEEITIEIDFKTQIPTDAPRTGRRDEYYLVSGWFPKFGVFENGAWNCRQLHWMTEFYSDFANYDVTIISPQEYIIGATGTKTKTEIQNSKSSWKFKANWVVDFAWTASPNYLVKKERHKGIDIELLLQKFHKGASQKYINAIKNAIDGYEEWVGKYPYPKITVVDPYPGTRTGGMEYPMFITCGTDFYSYAIEKDDYSPASVTIHEFGHQYFYNLLASDEQAEPWLDEGFTSFLSNLILEKYTGPNRKQTRSGNIISKSTDLHFPLPRSLRSTTLLSPEPLLLGTQIYPLMETRMSFLRNPDKDSISEAGFRNYNHSSYIANAYSKPELVLRTLKNIVGEQEMKRVLKTYFDKNKFHHPSGQETLKLFKQELNPQCTAILDQVMHSSGFVDYAVTDIRTRVEVVNKQENAKSFKSQSKEAFRSRVLVERLGEIKLPIEIGVWFENGSRWDFTWNPLESDRSLYQGWDEFKFLNGKKVMLRSNSDARWLKIYFLDRSKVAVAEVDPGYKIECDINLVNNSYTTNPGREYTTGIFARVFNHVFSKIFALSILN